MRFDRARAYGDGLFETVAIVAGRPRCWWHHMRRLRHGCERLGMAFPGSDALLKCVSEGMVGEHSVARIFVARQGRRGYEATWSNAPVDVDCEFFDWPERYLEDRCNGLTLHWTSVRLPLDANLGGLKHLNRLPEVMAASVGQPMVVTQDTHDRVVGATASNLFLRQGRRVYTPPVKFSGVAGVMREVVLDWLQKHRLTGVHAVVVKPIAVADVMAADEIWVTSALRGVCPVRQIGDRAVPSRVVADRLWSALGEAV